MANNTIKGFKIGNEKYGLNLTKIGSYIDSGTTEVEISKYINEHSGGSMAELVSSDGSKFDLKVDNNGELYAVKQITANKLSKPTSELVTSLGSTYDKLYINSFYCGGDNSDVHTINYCTHNFVELSNLTDKDINLEGLSLQYAKGNGAWIDVLPLKGIIKSGGTFLIRGAECSNYDSSKIKVEKYDMEWRNTDGKLIKFSDVDAPSFLLCFGIESFGKTNPGWTSTWPTDGVNSKFIDLVGVNTQSSNSAYYEKEAYKYGKETTKTALFKKYYAMDPVSQANKALSGRTNSSEWMYVDLTKEDNDLVSLIEAYNPKTSRENKNMYYDKSKLLEDKPSIITCSFGIQATDNGEGATRCFNWVSKGRHDEYVWIRTKGSQEWGVAYESFKNETGVRKYYNRLNIEYGDGVVFTVHKFIKKGLVKGEYEYIAGRANRDKTPKLEKCTEIRSFIVRSNDEISNGFQFIQTSDQQGFNWDEYRIWQGANYAISHEERSNGAHFMINTGDMTQNGSRMNEWLDYFNGKDTFMNNLEEMATVGNNDLSPKETYLIPDGKDNSKISLENFRYFYCYEMDEENVPVFLINSVEYYIPSLYSFNYGNTHFMCVVSEIKQTAETQLYEFANYGNFYPLIKEWCENDIAKNNNYKWNIAFCHEMPFTILTQDDTNKSILEKSLSTGVIDGERKGASININNPIGWNYWFSEFCQNNNVRLVMGGHKHTQSTSWPLLENVKYEGDTRTVYSWRPIIVLSDIESEFKEELTDFSVLVGYDRSKIDKATLSLVELPDGRKYPNTWIENGALSETAKKYGALCEFTQKTEEIKPVVYAMSQATSYKHTSNKELPSKDIPWLRYYYPQTGKNSNTDAKANAGQKYPFYTIWNVTDNEIKGQVRKVIGAFGGDSGASSGKFDINKDGVYVLNNLCATDNEHNKTIYSINGLGDKISSNDETIIMIK